jgi:branched-chain amino acid transport system substrate-binding protein
MRRLLPLVLLLPLLLPGGCQKQPRRIVIGIAITAGYHPAVELAMNQINASGGIRGVRLEAKGFDWKVSGDFNAPTILAKAAQFSEEADLIAVIGHSDSSSTLSAAAIYNQNRVPQIVTIATNPAITNIGTWTYRLCLSDAAQGPALAEYAVNDWGKKRIGMIYVNDAYGRGLAQLFESHAITLGAQIVSRVMHRNGLENDDKALIEAAIRNFKAEGEPDLIVLFQRIPAAEWTIKALRDAGIKSSILGGDSLGPINLAKSQPELMEGVRVSQFFFPLPGDSRATQFVEEFKKFTGKDPDYGHAFAYDAVYLLRDAALNGGSSREGVKSYLDRQIAEKRAGSGVAGSFVLGSDHDARREIYIVENHQGAQKFLKALQVRE